MTVVKITDSMLATVGAYDATGVSRVRRILEAAGLTVELHRHEIEYIAKMREQARTSAAAVERLAAMGPMPEHTCRMTFSTEGAADIVEDAGDCPFGCRPGEVRR